LNVVLFHDADVMSQETAILLARLQGFLLPEGDAAARRLSAVRIFEKGEMRSSEAARWMSFTSELTFQTKFSEFRWEARTGGVVITDAYENGHGSAMSRLAGLLTLKKASRGPALDRGEVQRYLSSLMLCPAVLVNHASLEWTAVAESVLRVRDTVDPTGAAVDFEIGLNGEPASCRTIRPRLVGRNAMDTEWVGKGLDFRLWNGMRMAHRLEVSWEVPGAPYCYYRSEVTQCEREAC
jgi:hypothetical protein